MNAVLVEARRQARGGEVLVVGLVVVDHDEAVVSRGGADEPVDRRQALVAAAPGQPVLRRFDPLRSASRPARR
ncbi:hypothetical protein ACWFRM_23920 [Streptomyces sp. NPDC055144]